jgi:hypothetical protein
MSDHPLVRIIEGGEMAKARRTTHRSTAGKKLYAVRDKSGRFKDIQTYERAHRADLAHKSKAELEAAAKKKAKKKKAAKKTVKKVKKTAKKAVKKARKTTRKAAKKVKKTAKKAARKR